MSSRKSMKGHTGTTRAGGRQGTQSRVLLANHPERLYKIREKMYQVSGIRPPISPQARDTPQHGVFMVICHSKNGHHWSLQPGKGQTKFLLVGVDYFTTWIEVKSLASISAKNVWKFVCKSIVCQFGNPHTIITDNGQQFIDRGLQSFYKDLDIKLVTSSVEYP